MILMYHKIAPTAPTQWWVEVDQFYRQLCELRGSQVVQLADYEPSNPDHVVITFDGVYENVAHYAAPLLERFGYPYELFVTSEYIGNSNAFDRESGEPEAIFANTGMLARMVAGGASLQWHTRTHPHLPQLSDLSVLQGEFAVPDVLRAIDPKGFKWIAYPHGEFDERSRALAVERFTGAVSCNQGSESDRFALNRLTVTNETSFRRGTIGVVVPCYRYGGFLPEALDSLVRQTRPPDKILIADDASPDNTPEVSNYYVRRYPKLITALRNEKNLGIVANFNQAVRAIGTDYVCFLGADNRYRSDFIERTSAVLDSEPRTAIAYTDFAMFGPLATLEYNSFDPSWKGGTLYDSFYLINFPDFTSEVRARLVAKNFIHGSSLYRRLAFDQVGGYRDGGQAEDHNLFKRILDHDWMAKRVPHPLLEYRKHSLDQANTRLLSQAELNFYKQLVREKDQRIVALEAMVAGQASITKIAAVKLRSAARQIYRVLPMGMQSTLRGAGKRFLVACQKCDHPIFRARFLIPESLRKRVGRTIWSIQKQYFP